MGLYLVIDPEEKTKTEILAALAQIDEQAQIIHHSTLALWRKDKGEDKFEFDLILLNFEEFEMVKWPDELKQLAMEVNQTKNPNILMIGYDAPTLKRRNLSKLDFYNFIFKPFDKLILKESIHLASIKKKRLAPLEIKAQKSSTYVAVLKEIELQSICELGFVTLSDEQIPVGTASKYFSNLFQFEKKMSTWAQCMKSIPHPSREKTFINQFQFYGMENGALMNLRKFIQLHKLDVAPAALWNLGRSSKIAGINMALIAAEGSQTKKLQADLEKYFANLRCDIIDPAKSPMEKKSPTYDIVLNWSELGPEALKKEFGDKVKLFWILAGFALEEDRTKYLTGYSDCFILPLDKNYFYKKLKIHAPDLEPAQDIELMNIFSSEKMKSANMIQISEINEAFIAFNYHRELTYKTFREFTLFGDDERKMIELQAFCAFAEKNANDKTKFYHQFLFFGMTDHYLKAIRVWLLQDYVNKKSKDN